MGDSKAITVALLCAIIGLAALYAVSLAQAPRPMQISDVNVGMNAELHGTVQKSEQRNGNLFLTLCEASSCIKVVAFKNTAENQQNLYAYGIRQGDAITARGRVEEYEGELELVVSSSKGLERG